MNKITHFIGQSLYIQLLNYFNRDKILSLSQTQGGKHYIKKFEPFWNFMIQYGNLNRMLPVLENLLANTNGHKTKST